jgi:hypothetical protein
MGMYDSVVAHCPCCGKVLEFQSKAGDCLLRGFHLDEVPRQIAFDLDGSVTRCSCGQYIRICVVPLPEMVAMQVGVDCDDP